MAEIPGPDTIPATAERAHDATCFLNRELSWLEFDARVLEEALDPALPILERLKFLGIFSSNLDEFFMVRVAGLKQQLASGVAEAGPDGALPAEVLAAVSARTRTLLSLHARAWREELRPELARQGIRIVAPAGFTPAQAEAARARFTDEVLPALTPLAVDPGHPFPHLRNRSLNVAVLLGRATKRRRPGGDPLLAVVQVPSMLPRILRIPSPDGSDYALVDQLIAAHVGDLFPGFAVQGSAVFRVTRNSDLAIDDDEAEDLLSAVREELRRRDRGAAVRLEIEAESPSELVGHLARALRLEAADVYRIEGPLQGQDLLQLADADPRPELRLEPHQPSVPPDMADGQPILAAIQRGDRLLHHPYESFDPVVRFVEEAADDPDVLAIKQTLYRTSGDSPFVRALSRAAENGKQVTALVEIKARFDEANNIAWALRLEESGVHVVYGVVGLKTHCKVALVVRRETGGIRRYVHLGTGNYNPQTARAYTDLSLFTAETALCEDVAALFNLLTGVAEPPRWRRLSVAPFDLQQRLLSAIGEQASRARRGAPARIRGKMNALVDPPIIRALYAASQAGVEIDLLVRGMCCLCPGVPGLSERIRIGSIVDRFLEHERLFAFGEGEETEVWLSSADWMPRNFHSRVEVMFPVQSPALRARLLDEVLRTGLSDEGRLRRLRADGAYAPPPRRSASPRSQALLVEAARRRHAAAAVLRPAGRPDEPA